MTFWQKFALYLVGLNLGSIGTTYNAHPGATFMAYFAACATMTGAFLVGTFALNSSGGTGGPANPSIQVGPPPKP